jgi:hypothetical protein
MPRYQPTDHNGTNPSVMDSTNGSIVEYASSSVEAQRLADKWNEGGRPSIPPAPDTSWVDDSEMGRSLLARPTRKQEKKGAIAI